MPPGAFSRFRRLGKTRNQLPATIHALSLDQCEQALRYVETFLARRRAVPDANQP
jgi:hypothetical protein